MKIGIVGKADRTAAWEQHIRPLSTITQVNLCATLGDLKKVDACLIVDDSADNLKILLEGIRRGMHCYLISKPPTNVQLLDRIHRSASEAGVVVQFSHWPSLAPATQWMMDEMQGIQFIHSTRQIDRTVSASTPEDFKLLWLDELGLCLKWIGGGVHAIDTKQIALPAHNPTAMHLFLRFENSSTASIFVYTAAEENRHERIIGSSTRIMECLVSEQTVRVGKLHEEEHLFFSKQKFDSSTAAEKSVLLFIKSIQLGNESAFNTYDALNLARTAAKIEQRINRFS